MPNIFRTGKHTNFKLGTRTEHENPHQRQEPWPPRSKVNVARSRDASDRCWPISPDGSILATQRLVGRLFSTRAVMRTSFKVKVTRPTNAYTVNAQYLPNGKAYELQTWYTDGARRPLPVADSRGRGAAPIDLTNFCINVKSNPRMHQNHSRWSTAVQD